MKLEFKKIKSKDCKINSSKIIQKNEKNKEQ